MARYKHVDTSSQFLAVDLQRQLIPGTFEHALNHLLDHEIDLTGFDARFKNDVTGASAFPPAMLLKVILFAYAQLQPRLADPVRRDGAASHGLGRSRRPDSHWHGKSDCRQADDV